MERSEVLSIVAGGDWLARARGGVLLIGLAGAVGVKPSPDFASSSKQAAYPTYKHHSNNYQSDLQP